MYKLNNLSKEQALSLKEGKALPVMEMFYSLQGEGFHTGKAAFFIRIGGCDIGCHWCDVKESWDANVHPLTDIKEIIKTLTEYKAKSAVITGGEPCIYHLEELTSQLRSSGIQTFIETSGAYPISGEWDWICISPKKNSPPISENYKLAGELKVIIHNKDDIRWAEEQRKFTGKNTILFLQPEWSKRDIVLPLIIEHVKENPDWRISLQTHKYLNIP